MPAIRQRFHRSEPRDHLLLILSHDAVAAALLGALVEILGYQVRFARPPESVDDSIRRVKPGICLVDCTDPDSCRAEFFGRATMRGICVIIFGTPAALDAVREVARADNIEMLFMPPDMGMLEAALQRAGDG